MLKTLPIPSKNVRTSLVFGLIMITGTFLRLFRLGEHGFWNDEVDVAMAAIQSTIRGALDLMRLHTMPMPLDYLIAWLIAKVSIAEAILRLPAAIWGILTLAASYSLFRKLANEKVALLSTGLLAISSLHIHYSQELRFYSALIFFYILSVYLCLKAIQESTLKNWVIYLIVTLIGVYFHPFAATSLVNGAIWLLILYVKGERDYKRIGLLVVCGILLALSMLPPYLLLESSKQYDLPLTIYNSSVWRETALGLGWMELIYNPGSMPGKVFGAMCFIFWIPGLVSCLRSDKPYLLGTALSIPAQVGLVIVFAMLTKYYYVYRQILHLLPLCLFITALGIFFTGDWISKWLKAWAQSSSGLNKPLSLASKGLIALTIAAIVVTSIPALTDYYLWPKSNIREVAPLIIEKWQPGDMIYVAPFYQEKVYHFYLQYVYKKQNMVNSLDAIEVSELAGKQDPTKAFLVYVTALPEDAVSDIRLIKEAGFKPIYTVWAQTWLGQSLFIKK